MNLKTKQFRAEDARQILNNDAWKMIWHALHERIEARELSCNVAKEPEVAADIIRCKQLLASIEREITRVIEDGDIAELQIEELNKKKTPLQRIFAR